MKLSCVATDVMGVSGRAMMRALIDGHADPHALAELAKGKLRKKLPELRKALEGRFRAHHAFLLERMLAHISELEDDIQAISGRVEEQIAPFEKKVELLCTIPGVAQRAAEVLIAETGRDMSAFPSAKHLASWAGVCPGQRESAGKRKSAKTRKGSPWLRATPDRVRARRRTHQGNLPLRALPPARPPPRRQESDHRDRPRDPHRRLAHAQHRRAVPRDRTHPDTRARHRARPPPRHQATRAPRPQGHPRRATQGRLTRSHRYPQRSFSEQPGDGGDPVVLSGGSGSGLRPATTTRLRSERPSARRRARVSVYEPARSVRRRGRTLSGVASPAPADRSATASRTIRFRVTSRQRCSPVAQRGGWPRPAAPTPPEATGAPPR